MWHMFKAWVDRWMCKLGCQQGGGLAEGYVIVEQMWKKELEYSYYTCCYQGDWHVATFT